MSLLFLERLLGITCAYDKVGAVWLDCCLYPFSILPHLVLMYWHLLSAPTGAADSKSVPREYLIKCVPMCACARPNIKACTVQIMCEQTTVKVAFGYSLWAPRSILLAVMAGFWPLSSKNCSDFFHYDSLHIWHRLAILKEWFSSPALFWPYIINNLVLHSFILHQGTGNADQ